MVPERSSSRRPAATKNPSGAASDIGLIIRGEGQRMTDNMRSHFWKRAAMILALALLVFAAGCKKKVPPPPPPLPPPNTTTEPPRETGGKPVIASFTAEPRTIAKGQSSTLRWSITGATDMSLDQGIGRAQANA